MEIGVASAGGKGKESRAQEKGKETTALLCAAAERWRSGRRERELPFIVRVW
jgi:hypothetical protein